MKHLLKILLTVVIGYFSVAYLMWDLQWHQQADSGGRLAFLAWLVAILCGINVCELSAKKGIK